VEKLRPPTQRSFSPDNYSQRYKFYPSMSAPEQRHIQSAFASRAFKRLKRLAIRSRNAGHLALVEEGLAQWRSRHGPDRQWKDSGRKITPIITKRRSSPIIALPAPHSFGGQAALTGRRSARLVTKAPEGDGSSFAALR